ncbi:hypothetical protein SAMN05880582_10625 [Rhizobium sp. RU20A]|uniref:DUF937 domain-containing protein n=1 Tax=Rhizobium sp. RU20A TaxID=1907412 RepID=UPI000953FBFA|nr:DUF937 domain-containing protein [Rhizobium sp. RU20A]SIR05811.1 hypothetical protein SAMN05880582_10625 [Rhizobium sp. RU20A]
MLPLYDMMMQAQNGKAVDMMARQFGLAQEQARLATEALMPAFSSALKRQATNPMDFTPLLAAMASGNYAPYFEDLARAFSPQGIDDGNAALGRLFGSKDVSRAIAAQAAQMTGIGQEIYKQMLPVVASALMGGFFKQMMAPFGQMGGQAAQSTPENPYAAMMRPFMEAAGLQQKPAAPANPFDNPFTQAMQGFFGMGTVPEKKPEPDLFAGNPFVKAYQDFLATAAKAAEPQETAQPTAKPEAKPQAASGEASASEQMGAFFNAMFDSGIAAQKEYQKQFDGLLETYMGKGKPEGTA